jgi:hypothetical protein
MTKQKIDHNIMSLSEFSKLLVALSKSDFTINEMAGVIKELYENHTNYDDLCLEVEAE